MEQRISGSRRRKRKEGLSVLHQAYLAILVSPQSVHLSLKTLFLLQKLLPQSLHILIGQSLLVQ